MFDGTIGEHRQRVVVIRSLDDHFVRADPVHAIEQAVAFAVEPAFNSQRRKFIWYHPNCPSGRVFAASISAVGNNLRRRLAFVAGTKRTNTFALYFDAFAQKFVRTLTAFRGNNDPSTRNRVPAKFRQPGLPVVG